MRRSTASASRTGSPDRRFVALALALGFLVGLPACSAKPEAPAPEASSEAPVQRTLTEADVEAMNRIPPSGTDAASLAYRAEEDRVLDDEDFAYALAEAASPPAYAEEPAETTGETTGAPAETAEETAPEESAGTPATSAEIREVERLLEHARAVKERAFDQYTSLATTGGEGRVEEALARYREAKELVDRLEGQLESMREQGR